MLEFEKPLFELYEKIDELKSIAQNNDMDLSDEINKMQQRAAGLQEKIFAALTPAQVVKLARHPDRPTTQDYIDLMLDEFYELHGDRYYGDDPSIIGGLGKLDGIKVVIIGHQKGRDTKENIHRNFGMSQPEGYRKALRIMKLAQKLNLPVITIIDTPGAFPGIEAEERGQAEAIARNLYEMSSLSVPIISIITGEGGSGGALGIALANEVLLLENAVYSVISPEGCASILWHDAARAPDAARALKLTARELLKLGVIDEIIKEPKGGAHRDNKLMADTVKKVLLKKLKQYQKISMDILLEQRYNKFRNFGFYTESQPD